MYAIQLANGKYLSRARFDRAWDGAFQLDHPELYDSYPEAIIAGAANAPAVIVPFEVVLPLEGLDREPSPLLSPDPEVKP